MHTSKIDFLSLAEKYGSPLYVYDLDQVAKRFTELKEAINYPLLKIHYAMKANYNPAILDQIRELGGGLDTVSPEEIKFGIQQGFQTDQMIYTANNLSNQEIEEVQSLGVIFNIGSTSELKRYGKKFPGSKVSIRFNPDVIAGGHAKIQTGGPLSKFGILLDYLEDVKEIAAEHDLKIVGLHEHTGSKIEDTDKSLNAIDNLLAIAKPEHFPDLELVNFGGGFYVAYHPEDPEITYDKFGEEIRKRMSALNELYNKEMGLRFEPGRFLSAEAGHLIIQVTTIKENREHLIAGTNSGFNHLARPVMYDAYHHIDNISNPTGEIKTYDIVGNICESGDNFASGRQLPEIREEDYLVIHNAGAYCYSMASFYNLRRLPAEVVIQNGNDKISSHDAIHTLLQNAGTRQ